MAEETVGLDAERATLLARECGDAGRAAGGLATEVRTALTSARLSTRSATLLSEIEFELASLRRVIDGTIEGVRAADAWWAVSPSVIAGRLTTELAERALWESLNDSTGASAIDRAPFDLSDSLRVMSPGEWRAMMNPPGCASFGPGRYYAGGGAVLGPDDRTYPVVVPHFVTDDGRHFTIDADVVDGGSAAASRGGADQGWSMVDLRTGLERGQAERGGWWELATGAAVATGLSVTDGIDDARLTGVHLRAGSAATHVDTPPASASIDPSEAGGAALAGPEPTVWLLVDGRVAEYPVGAVPEQQPTATQHKIVPRLQQTSLGRLQLADKALSLATGAATGFVAARHLDHGRHRAYEVIFEQHADGRRRARVQTFALEAKQWGTELYGWHLFVDEDGALRQSPMAYQYGPSVASGTARFAHNPLDPDFETGLGLPAFAATVD